MTKKEMMYKEIEKHGQNLIKIFHLPETTDPVKLCKKLFRLEHQAHRLATDFCNGENGVNTENWEELSDNILNKVDKILDHIGYVPVILNGDARGYALKIQTEWINNAYSHDKTARIHTDMGGYGIIAPDFRI